MLTKTTKEVYELVKELADKFATLLDGEFEAMGGTQGFLCSEGITGEYVITHINPDDLIRAHVANMWNKEDKYIQQIIDFLMHIYVVERNYIEERESTPYDPICE